MRPRVILDSQKFQLTLERLCHQLIENHYDFNDSVLIGVQPRGVLLGERLIKILKKIMPSATINYGILDPTFYRDDFRRKDRPISPSDTKMDFLIENKKVILIDDVLYTGRTVRAAMDALLDFGRPDEVELLVLIDRRFSRHLPIEANYVGKTVDAIDSARVSVEWKEKNDNDKVILLTDNKKNKK